MELLFWGLEREILLCYEHVWAYFWGAGAGDHRGLFFPNLCINWEPMIAKIVVCGLDKTNHVGLKN